MSTCLFLLLRGGDGDLAHQVGTVYANRKAVRISFIVYQKLLI